MRGVDIKESNFNHLIQEFTNIPRFEKFKRWVGIIGEAFKVG